MARYAPAALVAALLVATALAFTYTEQLKLTPSPIFGTRVPAKTFSPVCRCDTDTVTIGFRLREADRLEIDIVRDGDVVRRLVRDRDVPRGGYVHVRWNGRDDAGRVVAEGPYRPRVRLERQRRTIVLPNPIVVDTTPPRVRLTRLAPRVFSPDGNGRGDRVVVGYRLDEPARVSLLVDGERAVRKKGQKTEGTIDWYGRRAGRSLPRGRYRLEVEAVDLAGNTSRPTPARTVVIRYVALGRDRIETRPGGRIAVLVLADAANVAWKLGARAGSAPPGTLRLRAPLRPGRFTLTVAVGEHRARAAVIVREPAP